MYTSAWFSAVSAIKSVLTALKSHQPGYPPPPFFTPLQPPSSKYSPSSISLSASVTSSFLFIFKRGRKQDSGSGQGLKRRQKGAWCVEDHSSCDRRATVCFKCNECIETNIVAVTSSGQNKMWKSQWENVSCGMWTVC